MSRNSNVVDVGDEIIVAPREGRVSRNVPCYPVSFQESVAPREGRVSRNQLNTRRLKRQHGRAPRGACE